MNFRDIFKRIGRYFGCFKINISRKPIINIDDVLDAEYGQLNDPENPNSYF
jgi:hypothetical protein